MNLLRLIARSTWMMEPRTLDAYVPLAMRLAAGQPVTFPTIEREYPRAIARHSGQMVALMDDVYESDPGKEPEVSIIAVYPVRGMITKYDQECGPSGMETLMARLQQYDAMPEVQGHILEMDSGGGEATNIESAARVVASLQKPVIAWYNGMCASAAYYIACAADEIYASEETDEVGSIGAVVRFADMQPMWEKEGVKFHEIYADQSELKSLPIRKALEGEYDLLRNSAINPYAERFIQTVQEFRPGLTDTDAYKGRLYMTREAIEIGMIDGMATFSEVVSRMEILITEKKKSMSTIGKLFAKSQTPAQPEMIATAEVEESLVQLEQMLAELRTELTQYRTELTGLREGLEAQASAREAAEARLQSIEAARTATPGAGPSLAAAESDPPLYASDEEDFLTKLEKEAASIASEDGRLRMS